MPRNKKKVPTKAVGRETQKSPRIPSITTDGQPSWRFSTVDAGGPFAWPKGSPEEAEILSKLHDFDSMTWQELAGGRHHHLSPDSLSRDAHKRLCELQLDDQVENLFSFALGGKPRVICIRNRDTAKLLWHDPEHLVCPSVKKHT